MTTDFGRAVLAAAVLAATLTGCARAPLESSNLSATAVSVNEEGASAMISEYRRAHNLGGLTVDRTLASAAAAQAMAMARDNVLSHTIAGSLAQRLAAAGAPPTAADENVSGGYDTLAGALAGWRKSPPHNANLLDPKMRRMGIGSAYAANSKYHQYWSLILAD